MSSTQYDGHKTILSAPGAPTPTSDTQQESFTTTIGGSHQIVWVL